MIEKCNVYKIHSISDLAINKWSGELSQLHKLVNKRKLRDRGWLYYLPDTFTS